MKITKKWFCLYWMLKYGCDTFSWHFCILCICYLFLQWCNASKLKRCAQAAKDRTRWLKTNGKTSYFPDGRSMKLRILPAIRSLNLRMYLGFLLVMLWPLLSLSNAQQFDTASVNTELASASAAVIQGISTLAFHFSKASHQSKSVYF